MLKSEGSTGLAEQLGEMATKRRWVVALDTASKDGQVNWTKRRVTGALLLEPIEEENAPGWVLDRNVEKRTRASGFAYANSFPRVMGLVPKSDGSGKRKTGTGESLLSWENSNGNNSSAEDTDFGVGRNGVLHGLSGVVGSGMVEVSEARKGGSGRM